jgi:hypothetical protein
MENGAGVDDAVDSLVVVGTLGQSAFWSEIMEMYWIEKE